MYIEQKISTEVFISVLMMIYLKVYCSNISSSV